MAASKLNLQQLGIDSSEDLNISEESLKKIGKSINRINRNIANLCQLAADEQNELKEIKTEIAAKCAKLLERKKEISQNKKTIDQKITFFLGQVAAFQSQLQEAGLNVKVSAKKELIKALSRVEADYE